MSIHPSLKVDTAGAQQRTVLTRIERIKDLMKKGLWDNNKTAIGLPKTKIVKVKAKKAVKVAAVEGAAAEGAAPAAGGAKPAAGAAKPAAKAAAPGKK